MCFLLKKNDEQKSRNEKSPAIHVVPEGDVCFKVG